jgi:hypothetical protein
MCREPSGNRQTTLPSLLVALPLSTLPVLRLPPELPVSLSDTEGETEGEGEPSLGSTESETWLGKMMMMTEEGLSWPREATKLNHWTTAPGVGVEEGPASIHLTGLAR